MAVTSEVNLCNLALLKLADSPITSLTQGNTAANACNTAYTQVRDNLLSDHPWNFAIKRIALAADVTAPAFEFTTAYSLPSDFLKVKEIYDSTYDYQIEGLKLLTDKAAPLKLIYIARITDVTQFSPLFIQSLVLMLAIAIGPRISGDGFSVNSLAQELQQTLQRAKIVDAQDGTPPTIEGSFYTDVRENNSYLPYTVDYR